MTADARRLAAGVFEGDRRAIARAISRVEDEGESAAALVRAVHPRTGRAYLVGVTGAPGVGKSTLVDRFARVLRAGGRTVGVLAVDPSSPFSGGAVLGDRVRMQAHAGDPGVFVRSMASRGELGGLSRATGDAALVLDAAGFDVVVIETVGVGQAEVEVSRAADVTLVVTMPGGGDAVQTLKAGVMEIADVFVVNKADQAGADRAAAELEAMLGLADRRPGEWRPPVLRTRAAEGRGVDEVVEAVERFRARGGDGARGRRRARVRARVRQLAARRFLDHAEHRALAPGAFDGLVEQVADAAIDPYDAADRILDLAVGGAVAAGRAGGGGEGIGTRMKATLDHIGIAVRDLDEALAFYRDALGLEVGGLEEVPSEHVRARFVPVGEAALELLEATSAASAIARSIGRRGPGIHHITLRVDDIEAALAGLRARGVRLVDDHPRPGAGGSRVAFIHPSAAQGVLIELKEDPRA